MIVKFQRGKGQSLRMQTGKAPSPRAVADPEIFKGGGRQRISPVVFYLFIYLFYVFFTNAHAEQYAFNTGKTTNWKNAETNGGGGVWRHPKNWWS